MARVLAAAASASSNWTTNDAAPGWAEEALTKGERLRAARLLGAAESLREAAGAAMGPVEREEYEVAVAEMRLHADGVGVDSAWAEGREMGAEAAVELAVALQPTAVMGPARLSSSAAD